MVSIIAPQAENPIVEGNTRVMTQVMRDWTRFVSDLSILSGVGSPEGVVPANEGRLYYDTSGTAGAILYIKRDATVADDPKQGWVMV